MRSEKVSLSYVNKLVRGRGCYMLITDDQDIVHAVEYKAYDFNKKKFVFGDRFNERVKNWVLYRGRKYYTTDLQYLRSIGNVTKDLIKEVIGKNLRVEYTRICVMYASIYLMCRVEGYEYNYILFAVESQNLYCSFLKDCSVFDLKVIQGFISKEVLGHLKPKNILLPTNMKSKAWSNVYKLLGLNVSVKSDLCMSLVAVANKTRSLGLIVTELPCCEDLGSCKAVIEENTLYVCKDIVKDLPDYSTELMCKGDMKKLEKELSVKNISGYGLHLSDVISDKLLEKYANIPQVQKLVENEKILGVNVYYSISDSECVYIEPIRKCPMRVYIEEVRSILGETLFYAVCRCLFSFKKGEICKVNPEVISTGRSLEIYKKLFSRGIIPASRYMFVKGIYIKGFEDTDNEVKILCEYMGRDISVSYFRNARKFYSEEFPCIPGLDCDKFMDVVMKTLGYFNYKEYSFYYKCYIGNKYISMYQTASNFLQENLGKRGVYKLERYSAQSGNLIETFKYNKVSNDFEVVKDI